MCFYDFIQEVENDPSNLGKLCIFKVGYFYAAFGYQAYIFSNECDLKRICFIQNKICKAGVPFSSIQKYIKLLKEANISFCIFDNMTSGDTLNENIRYFEYNDKKYIKVNEYVGKRNISNNININCNECKNNKKINDTVINKLDIIQKYLESIKYEILKQNNISKEINKDNNSNIFKDSKR